MNEAAHRKILVVGPAWVGDMVMTQSLLKALKSRYPHCLIDVLAPAWTHPLLQRMPEVNQALFLPFQHGEFKLGERYQWGRRLRDSNYQQAIVVPNSLKSALIPFFANIPIRTGWRGEMRWGLLNDIRYLNKSLMPQMTQRLVALALGKNESLPAELPRPQLITSSFITSTLEKFNIEITPQKPILVLCPGAEFGPAKCWPLDYFSEVAQQKYQEGWDVWLLGSSKDQSCAEMIQAATQGICKNWVGKTTLDEAIDLLSLASVVVTNDSGLMHIASALNRPLVALYGSSSPEYTPPLNSQAKILSLSLPCSPCFQRECPLQHFKCMKDLHPKWVLKAIQELLE